MIDIKVVLPQPLGPTRSVIWPAKISRLTPRSAYVRAFPSPKTLEMPWHETATRGLGRHSATLISKRDSDSRSTTIPASVADPGSIGFASTPEVGRMSEMFVV